ncbi:MAG: ABC transporter ATP-binding protein [Planctomycetes bacterium]|nr:ABC transporter ATP-binding protein [Planctomycetota bacterium]
MMLEVVNLTKFYGYRPILEGISFAIDKGETVGFLGVNGAGKSTAMRIITGFHAPTHGQVRVAGLDPRLPAAREKFGYLPESNPLPAAMRVEEYLRFRAGLKGLSGKKAALAITETSERCNLSEIRRIMIGQLSKGVRQRVGLADSILTRPGILILDEPTSGLDPRQADETRNLITQLADGATIFFSSHILQDVERLCQRVIVLDNGRVAADGNLEAVRDKNIEERTIRIEMIAREPVRETLRAIPGVRAVSIESDPASDDALTIYLSTSAGVDLRREISLVSANRGWLITEMHLEQVRLEDIFRRLTWGG